MILENALIALVSHATKILLMAIPSKTHQKIDKEVAILQFQKRNTTYMSS